MKTGIILAGGKGKRAGGREKCLFSYKGETFIEILISTLSEVVDEIIVVARDEEQSKQFDDLKGIKTVCDIRKEKGPLGGLHAGINYAKGDTVFLVACDMPFVNGGIVRKLFDMINEYDAVIPSWNNEMLEPLHAVYKKEAVEKYIISHESLSLRAMIKKLNSYYVDVNSLTDNDSELKTFTNINNLEELTKLTRGESD
ncbi:molybdenum cofactor guanylyltransferase [Methanoplanus sp. FWC-SCC4]|uniref:Probable molybdenum cofactor guanylyltransferase n=1 Tax=Methanochimaera problematica TaxID=2609417 RepID=A0AA97FBW4_9EURY|nr:molybdenum cofactor guanylyltransferase [Methanoplanus sp. FWC-SCC4]WOF15692.1 molybdenum cofactor guanylyltransferase [Methanoplanus sp. FWC-SCC4]